ADLRLLQWVVTGYLLAQVAIIPVAGWMSDRFGAKRMYLTALTLFTAGSVLCALATSAELLVAARVVQGLGGGMVMPIGMSFLFRLAPPEQRGAVMGAFGIPILLGPALGPVLSGWLLEYADWRLIFLINLPVGVLAVALGQRVLPALRAQRAAGALDVAGFVLGPLAFTALSYGVSESGAAGWTAPSTLAGLAIGAGALLAFVARELTTLEPLLELRVFRSRDFSLAIVVQWIASATLFGTILLVPLFLQQVQGYGALETGLYTLPQAIVAAVAMPIGGRLFDRVGARPPVLMGLLLLSLSVWLLTGITATTTGVDLLPPLALWGAGVGLLMMPLNTHILSVAPRGLVSRVTSLTSAMQNVAASLAIAGLATYLQGRTTARLAASGASLPNLSTEAGGSGAASFGGDALAPAVRAAFAGAFADTFWVVLVGAVVGILIALTLRRPAPVPAAEAAAERGAAVELAPIPV
ncbi:MAG: DHA2 family efflux MFS transporter permease subunit, partial [Chloroflexota bacterium]|nr:DHA2 family efflux MFS transporter permease subunit [Chloroflexota bacterium]